MTDVRLYLKSSVFPFIVTVAMFIEGQPTDSAIYTPSTYSRSSAEYIAVTGLRRHRWGQGSSGNSPVNLRLETPLRAMHRQKGKGHRRFLGACWSFNSYRFFLLTIW